MWWSPTSVSRGSSAARRPRRCRACLRGRPSTGRRSRPPGPRPGRRRISTRSAASSSSSSRDACRSRARIGSRPVCAAHTSRRRPLRTVAPHAPSEAVRIVDILLARQPAVRGDATASRARARRRSASLPGAAVEPAPVAREAAPTLVTRVLREPVTIIQRVRSHRPVPRARIAAVVLLLAAVIGLAGGVFAVAGGDPAGVKAPDVVGTKVARGADRARRECARRGAAACPKLKIVDRSYSESAPAGAIIAQDPPEGDRITGNGALLVSVSRGSAYADVPSVTGLTGADAFALLERLGFTPSRSYAPSTRDRGLARDRDRPGDGYAREASCPRAARRLDRAAEAPGARAPGPRRERCLGGASRRRLHPGRRGAAEHDVRAGSAARGPSRPRCPRAARARR